MQRAAGVMEDIGGRDLEPALHQYRQMIEVEEYASQPKKPETSQCSSTGCK
jgi:hypothetical protein